MVGDRVFREKQQLREMPAMDGCPSSGQGFEIL